MNIIGEGLPGWGWGHAEAMSRIAFCVITSEAGMECDNSMKKSFGKNKWNWHSNIPRGEYGLD